MYIYIWYGGNVFLNKNLIVLLLDLNEEFVVFGYDVED